MAGAVADTQGADSQSGASVIESGEACPRACGMRKPDSLYMRGPCRKRGADCAIGLLQRAQSSTARRPGETSMTRETGRRTLLSLDGGGIRGLISARILARIEELSGRPVHQLFDLIAGTSTGGILAAGLARPGDGKADPVPAKELAELYAKRGREIFSRSFWKGVTSLGGNSDEKYDAAPLENILQEMLGSSELVDTTVDLVVTSYDIERRRPYLFKTRKARTRPLGRNHLLRHMARATSAAPTYFETFLLDESQWEGERKRRALIDGGVFANNPAMIALSEALHSGTEMKDIVLCSVGTGMHDRKIPYEEAKDWGPLGWARPAMSAMMDGMSDSAHYHAQLLLPCPRQRSKQRYFRFDVNLGDEALDDLDAAHGANVSALLRKADEIIEGQGKELGRLVGILTTRADEVHEDPEDQGA